MADTNTLRLRFEDRVRWSVRVPDAVGSDGSVDMVPVGSRDLRRTTIDFLQGLLSEYREVGAPDAGRIEDVLGLIGEHLFELAFRDTSREQLERQLQALEDRTSELLRIELEFVGAEREWLSSLPWEYIRTPFDFRAPGVFLALLPTEIVLNRVLTPGQGARKLQAPQPWKVLVVCCSPRDSGLVAVSSEYVRTVVSSLAGAFELVGNELARSEGDPHIVPDVQWVTETRVGQAISKWQPHIIHFIGHGRQTGGKGELAFEGIDGREHWLAEDSVALLAAQSSDLKLVFLQACESALPAPHLAVSGVARRVAAMNIPAVVAMQDKVQPQVANIFAEGFYQALSQNLSVDRAVKAGRDQVKQTPDAAQRTAFGLPVLYLQAYGGMRLEMSSSPRGGVTVVPRTRRTPTTFRCQSCGQRLHADAGYCTNCGLSFTCASCKKRLQDPLGRYCNHCRHPIRRTDGEATPEATFTRTAPVNLTERGVGRRRSAVPGEHAS